MPAEPNPQRPAVPAADPPPEESAVLAGAARAAAACTLTGTDPHEPPRLMRRMDETALLGMARTLRDAGLFRSGAAHTAEEIAAATGTAERHRWILRRWLAALCREGLLEREEGPPGEAERYRGLRQVGRGELRAAVRELDPLGEGLGYPPPLREFFQQAIGNLPRLLRDEVQAQTLLFADGDSGTADGAYRDNRVNRYVNAAAAEAVRCRADAAGAAPLRVLEVGAGVGGTTADVLTALEDRPVDYLFTDVSRYFLDLGRERFGHRPGLRFALLDANTEPLGAGVAEPATQDVVLAVNVLHNAYDIDRCLRGVRDLLAPGGWLLCVDTCRELYQILTSMQFLMSPRPGWPRPGGGDLRAGTDRIFLSLEEWTGRLRAAGLQPALTVPGSDHPLSEIGVTLFAARRPE